MKEKFKLRILGLCRHKNGSSYHRVQIPLNYLNGQKVEVNGEELEIETRLVYRELEDFQFREQDLEWADVVVNNYTVLNIPSYMELFCKKYGVIWWVDIDDCLDLPSNHVNMIAGKQAIDLSKTMLVKSVISSDMTTVTNDLLVKDLMPVASLIGTSENFLPIGDSQFVPKPEKRDGRIVIGIVGSISHLRDWQSISSVINKLKHDREIQEKCAFYIGGIVRGDKMWNKVEKLFENSKVPVIYEEMRDVDSYMELYNKVDILLAPLENNEFNSKKSGLKILEASIKKIPVLSSEMYLNKEFNGYILCKNTKDWVNSIKQLIQKDGEEYEFEKVGRELSRINLEANNFELRIEKLKIGLKYALENPYKMDENLKVFSIVYDKGQLAEYTIYDNSHIRTVEQKSYLFEWNVILDIIDNQEFKEEDYIGIFSHKFNAKTHIGSKLLDKVFKDIKSENYDVIGLSPQFFKDNYLSFTAEQHPGFMDIFVPLCEDLGLTVLEPSKVIYSNFFLAKKEIYSEFVNTIIKPAIELLETKYKDLAWKDANYASGLPSEKLKEVSGLDYYTFHAFILERLMSIWLENNRSLKFKQLA